MHHRRQAMLPLNAHGAFDLDGESKTELPSDVKLPVAPLVIRQRRGQLDPALASHHDQLGELALDDEALLDQGDMQSPGHQAASASEAWASLRRRVRISKSIWPSPRPIRSKRTGL